MIRCVAVYPQLITEESKNKLKNYIQLAKKYHFEEVFTSIHLPEFTLEEQLDFLNVIAKIVEEEQLDLTVDIGGNFIKQVLSESKALETLKQTRITFLRMDYGYTLDQLKQLFHHLNIKGFVINASIYTALEYQEIFEFFKNLDSSVEVRTCHNFYLRDESGLDRSFALQQKQVIEKYNVPIYYCIPTHDFPRGPLYLGLPTIETHRYQSLEFILLDLLYNYEANAIMMSDEWINEKQFRVIDDILNRRPIEIPVVFEENATKEEKEIVLQHHHFRYDSNHYLLRSQSSREMAEFATSIPAHPPIKRKKASITIDNELYGRYSGELQVVLQDAKSDERINVVAHLKDYKDLEKLQYFRNGIDYIFIEEKSL